MRCTTDIPDLSLVKLKVVATDMQIRIILWTTSCTLMSQRGLLKAEIRFKVCRLSLISASSFIAFLLITQPEDNLTFLHLCV